MLNIIVTSLTQSATNWKNRTVIFIFIASNKKCDVWTHGVVEKAICHEHWLRVTIVSFNLTMEKYYKAAMEKYYKVLLAYFCGWTKYFNLFKTSNPHDTESKQLIHRENRLAGFCEGDIDF